MYRVLLSCPKGLENLLEKELSDLSIPIEKQTVGGVYVTVSRLSLYQIIIQSRLINRALLHLYSVPLTSTQALYEKSVGFEWDTHFNAHNTIHIDFSGQNDAIKNSLYGAQLIKDGVCDYFREKEGIRPNVSKQKPDIQLRAYLRKSEVSVFYDVVGESLHKRGYRIEQGAAPLKENIACALLMHAGWGNKSQDNFALIDPFCGSGTLLIEASLIASNTAPGLKRTHHALNHWKAHDLEEWSSVIDKAKLAIVPFKGTIIGFDIDKAMVDIAKANIERAGLSDAISVSTKDIKHFSPPRHLKKGLLITNPPYGERLSDKTSLLPLYQSLGRVAKQSCPNWTMGVITSDEKLSRAIGLKSSKRYKLKNGALDCQFALFELGKDNQFNQDAADPFSNNAIALLNRLKKNSKKLAPWLKKENITCFRLYDADLPDYNAAIDIYEGWVHVQEYAPPKTIDEKKAHRRLEELVEVLVDGLDFEREKIVLKQRKKQKSTSQYEVLAERRERITVHDGKMQCYVNLYDYLDTGLFLDHRRLRKQFSEMKPKTFLNLYCYTGVASLHAASGGAITTNVDLSNTYLNWAKDNFRLNHLTIDKHGFIQADVMAWLKEAKGEYDVIFCDPPSFSNSKRMDGVLDIQRDHQALIQLCMNRLSKKGVLYFSCNLKTFKLDADITSAFQVEEITQKTTSRDFEQARMSHRAYKITRPANLKTP